MLSHLIESAPPARGLRGVPGTTLSVVFHAMLIAGAVAATRDSALAGPNDGPRVISMSVYRDETPAEPPPPIPFTPTGPFITLDAPVTIPTVIPPIDSSVVVDPRLFARNRTTDPVVPDLSGPTVRPGAAVAEREVEERPEQISAWAPAYPDLLRQAGIEGMVIVEVIIDTAGRAEPSSLRIVQSSNGMFDASAREAVLRSRYRPGRIHGQAVRVLVQVPISFTIRRG